MFVCLRVKSGGKLGEPALWVGGKSHHLFLLPLCLSPAPGPFVLRPSQQPLRAVRRSRGEGLWPTCSGSEGSGRFGVQFPLSCLPQGHSFLGLRQDGACGWVEGSHAVHVAWKWVSAAHVLCCTLFSWLQCTNSTGRKQLPRLCFHTRIRGFEALFVAVRLPLSSVYKDAFPSVFSF